jgi:PAS domain S-box-containing protein
LRETEAIMRNAPVGIVLTGDRCILRYDRKFAEMYGFEGDQGDGRARACAVPLRRGVRRARRGGRAAASPGQPFQDELFMRRQDGSDFWANVIGYVQNLDDTSEATIWIAEDGSAQKRAEEELQRANADLALARKYAKAANRGQEHVPTPA